MDNVSRPLIALLVGTVAFFALWMTALKPSSKTSGTAGQYQSAIDKARQAVGGSNAASLAHGGTVVSTAASVGTQSDVAPTANAHPATVRTGAMSAVTAHPARATNKLATPAGAKRRLGVVTRALSTHRVVAILFYNPSSADDRAVKQELAAVPAHGRKVVKLTVPLGELASYTIVTNQVPVAQSPTLVLIDQQGRAATIVGFADRFEIAQRVADALAVK